MLSDQKVRMYVSITKDNGLSNENKNIMWIARQGKRSTKVVARANSEDELDKLLEARDNPKESPKLKEEKSESKSTKVKNTFRPRKAKK